MDSLQAVCLGGIIGALFAINSSIDNLAVVIRNKDMTSSIEEPVKPVNFLTASAHAYESNREPERPLPPESRPMKERVIVPTTLPNRPHRDGISDSVDQDVEILGYPGVWSDRNRRLQEKSLDQDIYIYGR